MNHRDNKPANNHRAWGSGIGAIQIDRRDDESKRPLRAPLVNNEKLPELRLLRESLDRKDRS